MIKISISKYLFRIWMIFILLALTLISPVLFANQGSHALQAPAPVIKAMRLSKPGNPGSPMPVSPASGSLQVLEQLDNTLDECEVLSSAGLPEESRTALWSAYSPGLNSIFTDKYKNLKDKQIVLVFWYSSFRLRILPGELRRVIFQPTG